MNNLAIRKPNTTPELPITREIGDLRVTLDKNIVFGKGDFVMCIQDTSPEGKYFEVYMNKQGRPIALPMEWTTLSDREQWGTTSMDQVRAYVQNHFDAYFQDEDGPRKDTLLLS